MSNQLGYTTFNPNDHLLQIKNKGGSADYLPVQYRLVWVHSENPREFEITILSEIIEPDRITKEEVYVWNNETRRSEKVVKEAPGWARYHVRVRIVTHDGRLLVAEGIKTEGAASFTDYPEKACTGAIGRALATLGYGTQFTDEFDEKHRIVDAPVDRGAAASVESQNQGQRSQGQVTNGRVATSAANGNRRVASGESGYRPPQPQQPQNKPADENDPQGPVTEQQLASLQKLYQHLGRQAPATPLANYKEAKELIAQLSQEYRQSRSQQARS
jgi:hypothetical protein